MRKRPSPALRGACQSQEVGHQGKGGEQASQDTVPSQPGWRGGRGVTPDRPGELSLTHLEDLSIRAVAQAAEPVETLLEEGLRPARVIPGALQGLGGSASERHPLGLGLVPAWGPRREEAADGDAALGRGPGREAPTEPPRPLEGEARFCMAEVGWNRDGGATQRWRGALFGHRHVQHRSPLGAEFRTVCHSKQHLVLWPQRGCRREPSLCHTHTLCLRHNTHLVGKGIQMYARLQVVTCTLGVRDT